MIQKMTRRNSFTGYLFSVIALLLLAGCAAENEKDEASGTLAVTAQNEVTDNMVVHYIDVGQGDATLLKFSDDEGSYTMLIDTGDWVATDVVDYFTEEITQLFISPILADLWTTR